MRPPEAKNLRWRDITTARDKDGSDILVIYVQGKGKTRKLIAPKSTGEYFERVRDLSKATKPDDPVFTIINGKPAQWLYRDNRGGIAEIYQITRRAERHPAHYLLFPPYLRHAAAFQRCRCVYLGAANGHIGQDDRAALWPCEHHQACRSGANGIVGWDAMHVEMNAEIDAQENQAKAVQAIKAKQAVKPRRAKR
ncbi:MAG: hypothetical protein WDN44_07755 [Sphingomonas sp.]